MHTLILHPTAVSQWQALVLEAEQACEINLDTELESYLVFLLMRFLRHQDIADSILALEFLHSLDKHGQVRYNKLRDLGDKCLLFSGLFPERALRRHVKISYFIALGQTAYDNLAALAPPRERDLFTSLAQQFLTLMEVLQGMRAFYQQQPVPVLSAVELWQDTGSDYVARYSLSDLKKQRLFTVRGTKRLQ